MYIIPMEVFYIKGCVLTTKTDEGVGKNNQTPRALMKD